MDDKDVLHVCMLGMLDRRGLLDTEENRESIRDSLRKELYSRGVPYVVENDEVRVD